MKKVFLLLLSLAISLYVTAQVTYVYFENSTPLNFSVTSTQTGTHILEPNEWWYSTAAIAPWQDETNVLRTNRNTGIHWGDDFYLTTTLTGSDFAVSLKLKLHGDFVGSTIWSAASGPGFSHGWTSDRNFHTALFTVNGKQYELKYTFYFTGGADDILYTLHQFDAFKAAAAELSNPDIMNVLAYNTYMLTPPIALSDQGTRALHIDEAVHNVDAILIQEVFDNSARATLLAQLAIEYPYQTPVVDLPNILEDGGVMIVSRWPIEHYAQMVWNNCNEPDCLANKGVMYARINKLGRKFHLFSTHQQAFNGADDVAVRNLQMQQFNAFINAQNIPADEAVIFGGDMNVDKHTNKYGEYNNMFSIFNASVPTYYGHNYTWDKYTNHYIGSGDDAPEYLDYVLSDNDYLDPIEQSNSVWIMRSNHNDMWNIHDLSDHHAVLGRFVYPSVVDPCTGVTVSISAIAVDESSAGAGDGSIDITVSGGTAPYTYGWSNGSTSEDLAGLAPGTYTVNVADANGCTGSAQATVGTSVNCIPATAAFAPNPLTHSGAGSASTTLSFPAGSMDASFVISGINQVIDGKTTKRYIERVTVTYVNGNGNTQTYGTYSGASVTTANIAIAGGVQSVTVRLDDIYDGNSSVVMSVNTSTVNYCSGETCPDADGDGVCDADDICPGGDDNIDTDGDGIPDFCDTGGCTEVTTSFSVNPLTHSGSGSSSTTLNLPAGHTDASFTISNINSKLDGKGSTRYIERVTVTYVDGGGNSQTYGVFNGTGTADVAISGPVQSITVSLSDGYDGNAPITLSVNPGAVTSCSPAARLAVFPDAATDTKLESTVDLYPNPTTGPLFIRYHGKTESTALIRVFSIGGHEVMRKPVETAGDLQLDVSSLLTGIYILQIVDEAGSVQAYKFIKQ